MPTTLRITLDAEMLQELALAENILPGLNPPQIIRVAFKSWIRSRKISKIKELNAVPDLSDEEFDDILNSLSSNPSNLKLGKNSDFGDWWQKNKKSIRG